MENLTNTNLHVLHLFEEYLPVTQNWAFALIRNLPHTIITVASKRFIPDNFYPDRFKFIEFPFLKVNSPNDKLVLKIANRCVTKILQILYSRYILKNSGRYDIMHSHFATVGWEYLNLAKRMNTPHVVSFYGLDYQFIPFRRPVWNKRYHALFREADLFLCEGENGAEILKKKGCPPEKIRIARLGVNTKKIKFIERRKKRGELHLLQIASFRGKKGHKYTIDAFITALKSCSNMTLTFAGPGIQNGLKRQLEHRIKNSSAEGRIYFLKAIEFDRLHKFMSNYHVFIHPSCYTNQMDCEGGAPIVLLDAQATGMPVISTNHCDIPSEVIHKKTGLLSPEKDRAKLTESIRVFFHMQQKDYDVFAKNARENVENNYDIRLNANKVREFYDSLTARPLRNRIRRNEER